jgi:hypothetical protein
VQTGQYCTQFVVAPIQFGRFPSLRGLSARSNRLSLPDATARREPFTRLGRRAGKILALTEGLIIYISAAQVRALAEEFALRLTRGGAWLPRLVGSTVVIVFVPALVMERSED